MRPNQAYKSEQSWRKEWERRSEEVQSPREVSQSCSAAKAILQ